MADLYVDHGAYATNIGTTPTWGTPQEGDGSATAAASASGTASIVFTANATGGSSSVTICGITFTATTHFTVGASLSATLDNLVNAINANSGPGASTVATGVAIGTPKLCNLVFARKTGTDTLDVMMRVGSATLNGATNTNCRLTCANWTTSTSLPVDFAGGSGGCWGWLLNSAAIGVSSSIAALAYGLLKAIPMVCSTVPGQADIVWARSGSGKTITSSASSFDLSHSFTNGATAAWSCHLIVDSNTKWTGDSGTGVVTIRFTALGSTTSYMPGPVAGTGFVNWAPYVCSYGALAEGGLKFDFTSTGTAYYGFTYHATTVNQNPEYWNVLFVDNSSGSNSVRLTSVATGTGGGTGANGRGMFTKCTFTRTNSIASLLTTALAVVVNTSMQYSYTFRGCKFNANVSGATANPIVDLSTASIGPPPGVVFSFQQCDFTGFSGGGNQFALHNSITSMAALAGTPIIVEAIDCTGVSLTSSYAGLSQKYYAHDLNNVYLLVHSPTGGGPYRKETLRGVIEWNPAASPAQPTLSAVQPTGTAWSYHARWLATTDVVERSEGFELPAIRGINQNAAGTRTIKVKCFMHSSLFSALGPRDISITVSYVDDSTGVVKTQLLTGVPSTSSATWTGAAGYASHVAKEWSFTTAAAVKQNTEISAVVTLRGVPRSGVAESVFFDPELAIT